MYRQYRIGDLPDIQIKHSAVIAPLQALAQVGITLFEWGDNFYQAWITLFRWDILVVKNPDTFQMHGVGWSDLIFNFLLWEIPFLSLKTEISAHGVVMETAPIFVFVHKEF